MQTAAAIIVHMQGDTPLHVRKLCWEQVCAQASEAGADVVLAGAPSLIEPFANATGAAFAVYPYSGSPAGARNGAAALTHASVLVFASGSFVPSSGWLRHLLDALAKGPDRHIVGGQSLHPDGRLHNAGLTLHYGTARPVNVHCLADTPPTSDSEAFSRTLLFTADAMAVRADTFRRLGGFDEAFVGKGDDIDFGLRAHKAGCHVAFVEEAQGTTVLAAGYGLPAFASDEALLQTRWLGCNEVFEQDMRHLCKGSAPRALSSARPIVTVVSLVLPGALPTLGAWLELTKATLGPNDAWLIVNNTSCAASSGYARWLAEHTENTQLIDAAAQTQTQAWLAALDRCHTTFIAAPAPNALPSWHWLERGAAHLARNTGDTPAFVAASLPPLACTAAAETAIDLNVVQRALASSLTGKSLNTVIPESQCFIGEKAAFTKWIGTASTEGFIAPWEAIQGVPTALDVWSTQMGVPTRPGTEIESMGRRQTYAAANLWLERQGTSAAAAIQKTLGVAPHNGLVTVVVPVLNQPELTRRFLESVFQNTRLAFELVLVDNGSGPSIAALAQEFAAQHPNFVFVRNEANEGFGYACNQGIAMARGEAVVIINNDVIVPQGWLSRLLAVVQENPNIGMVGPVTNRCVGPQQIFPAPYCNVDEFPRAAAARATTHAANVANVGRLVGLCLLLPMPVIRKVGGFDPSFGFGNLEDDDLGLRVRRAGWQLAVAEDVLIHHEGSATFTGERLDAQALAQQNWEIFCLKWRHDPANTSFVSIAALAVAGSFDSTHDYVPPIFSQHFTAAGPKLSLDTDKPVKLLFTPDVLEPGWWAPLRTFLGTFGPEDPVALVLRPEPATNERAQQALQEASALLNQLATAKTLPVVLLEVTNLPPLLRPNLYRAMTAWLDTPGPLAPFIAREAAAVGLPRVLPSAQAMRAFVAQHSQEPT